MEAKQIVGITSACRAEFPPAVRERGAQYFAQNRVRDFEHSLGTVYATVLGSSPYETSVDWESTKRTGEVIVSCDCPYYEDHGCCKHLWATMLEIDEMGLFDAGSGPFKLLDTLDEKLIDDYSDYSPISVKRTSVSVKRPPAPPKAKAAPKLPAWQLGLNLVAQANRDVAVSGVTLGAAALDGSQILYVIDVTLSQSSGQFVLILFRRERKKNGEFGKPSRLSLRQDNLKNYRGHSDADLLATLLQLTRPLNGYSSPYLAYSYNYGSSEFEIQPAAQQQLFPRLSDTGRLYWALNTDNRLSVEEIFPVQWDGGAPWRFGLRAASDPKQKEWLLEGSFERDATTPHRRASDVVFANDQGVVLWPDSVGTLASPGQRAWIDLFRRYPSLKVPHADRAAFLKKLWEMPSVPDVDWPDDLRVETIVVAPRGHLAIRAPDKRLSYATELLGTLSFDYNGTLVRANDSRKAVYQASPERVVRRQAEVEQRLLAELADGPLRGPSPYHRDSDCTIPAKELTRVVERLSSAGWIVEAEGALIRRAGDFHVSVTSGVDWFELAGEFDFDGATASLPDVLAALRKGERYVRLGDGSQGLLPQEWLAKYGVFAELGSEADGKIRFRPTQAMLLDALLAEQGTVKVDRGFREYRRKLDRFAGVAPAAPPRGFQGELRPYQQVGLGWMRFLQDFGFGGCLADDMGLGKTVQVLALLEQRRTRRLGKEEERLPSLVVVPRSLIFNWQAEAERFAPKLRVLNFSQPGRKQLWDHVAEHDVVLTTYGTLLRDIVQLKEQPFDYAILDEAQAIKNSNSQSAKASRLLNARHRLALTGTPIENHLGELWSLVEFLNPGMLGRSTTFARLSAGGEANDDAAQQRNLLAQAVRPIVLRRTKAQVLSDLPEKTEQTLYCELSTAERKKYNELRDYYRASLTKKIDQVGLEKSKIHVLEALLRLRQASCHLGLLDAKRKKDTSAKLDALLEHLQELGEENHKALVFSQFTQLLDIVRGHLNKHHIPFAYLDGQTRNREAVVEQFQNDPQCPVFLISLKAGGRGLNLTAADYVFILDPWWNPAVEAQAVDRAHRIGQTRSVFAYRLIARDTVEEKILELQQSKRELADSIISADSSVLKNLTADDLRLLLA
jgi:superfamily II DNA or RNA helicase